MRECKPVFLRGVSKWAIESIRKQSERLGRKFSEVARARLSIEPDDRDVERLVRKEKGDS